MEFKTGQTKVRVMKATYNEHSGKLEKVDEIHVGVVIQQGTSFVRVYNGDKDTSQTAAEMFPIKSKLCWVEIVGERERPLRIAPELR